jgi:hypothetical protein
MFVLSLCFAIGSTALAEGENRPLRPTTHPADPALSEGLTENFQRLYVSPENISKQLKPQKSDGSGLETLPILNRTTGWVDVEVNGTKLGRIGPLTTALIHNVEAGEYLVSLMVENTQYTYTESFNTLILDVPVTPGNRTASIAGDEGYYKPGFDDIPERNGGKLVPYLFPGESVSKRSVTQPSTEGTAKGEAVPSEPAAVSIDTSSMPVIAAAPPKKGKSFTRCTYGNQGEAYGYWRSTKPMGNAGDTVALTDWTHVRIDYPNEANGNNRKMASQCVLYPGDKVVLRGSPHVSAKGLYWNTLYVGDVIKK